MVTVVSALDRQRGLLMLQRPFGDIVDEATGVDLAVQQRGRTLHDFDAFDVRRVEEAEISRNAVALDRSVGEAAQVPTNPAALGGVVLVNARPLDDVVEVVIGLVFDEVIR
jgi:hypothetical protein